MRWLLKQRLWDKLWVCSQCGAINYVNRLVCDSCGKFISEDDRLIKWSELTNPVRRVRTIKEHEKEGLVSKEEIKNAIKKLKREENMNVSLKVEGEVVKFSVSGRDSAENFFEAVKRVLKPFGKIEIEGEITVNVKIVEGCE